MRLVIGIVLGRINLSDRLFQLFFRSALFGNCTCLLRKRAQTENGLTVFLLSKADCHCHPCVLAPDQPAKPFTSVQQYHYVEAVDLKQFL